MHNVKKFFIPPDVQKEEVGTWVPLQIFKENIILDSAQGRCPLFGDRHHVVYYMEPSTNAYIVAVYLISVWKNDQSQGKAAFEIVRAECSAAG